MLELGKLQVPYQLANRAITESGLGPVSLKTARSQWVGPGGGSLGRSLMLEAETPCGLPTLGRYGVWLP